MMVKYIRDAKDQYQFSGHMVDEAPWGSGSVEVNVAPYCVQGSTMMMTLMTMMTMTMMMTMMVTMMMTTVMMSMMMTGPVEVNIAPYCVSGSTITMTMINILTIIITTKLMTVWRWWNDSRNQNILIIILILSGASTRKHDNKTAPGMKIVRLYRNQSFVLYSLWSINSISCHVFCQRIIPGVAEMQHLKIDSF